MMNYTIGKENTELKQNTRKLEKHKLCDEILLDAKPLTLTALQKKRVHFLIDKFTDFKKLHGNASKQAIILSFIFFIKMTEETNLDIDRWSITRKCGLNKSSFETIICRIANQYMMEAPLIPVETTEYDHDLLSRNGGKI